MSRPSLWIIHSDTVSSLYGLFTIHLCQGKLLSLRHRWLRISTNKSKTLLRKWLNYPFTAGHGCITYTNRQEEHWYCCCCLPVVGPWYNDTKCYSFSGTITAGSHNLGPEDQLFQHVIVDHLRANNLTIHNLYNCDQIPLGKTLWAFFSVPDPKNRFWKSFNTANQCSVMGSSQRSFAYLFPLSPDNTLEMFHCYKSCKLHL